MAESFISRKGGSSGNAVASDLLSGKTATVSTGDITGTMSNNGTVNITPSTTNQTISQGYHSGSGVVYGDSDLVAGNIKSGVNIFGIDGSLVGLSGLTFLSGHAGSYAYTWGGSTVSDLGSLKTIVSGFCGGYLGVAKIEGSTNNSTWVQLAYTGTSITSRYTGFTGGTSQYRYIRYSWESNNSTGTTVYAGGVFGY